MKTQAVQVGDTMFARGLNMQCRPTVCRVKIQRMITEPNASGYDCVVRCEDGVLVKSKISDLKRTRKEVLA